MRRGVICLFGCIALLALGCSEERVTAPSKPLEQDALGSDADAEALAWALVERAGWEVETEGTAARPAIQHPIVSFEREVIVGDIAHYAAQIRIGPGAYDLIGLHRVIREPVPGHPIRTDKALLLNHGAGKDFVGNFLPGLKSPRYPDDFGHAVFLAQHDVDIWGIDNSYLLVPVGLPDFLFMQDWGIEKHVTDLGRAIETARVVRWITGNGYRKMILSGYSAGAAISYVYLNEETQRPRRLRKVSAFAPVDWGLYTDNEALQAHFCAELELAESWLAQGIYGYYDETIEWGILARDHPDEPSPINPEMTNLEFLLTVASTGSPEIPAHYWAGIFDEEGTGTGLQYTEVDMLVDFWITSAPAGQPVRLVYEGDHIFCPAATSPWDDHLSEIDVPILNVSAAGGYGLDFEHTLGFLGSADVTNLVVQLHPDDERLLDYGHIDLYTASNAQGLFWQPMLEWIEEHSQ
jgi:hypothetical protein